MATSISLTGYPMHTPTTWVDPVVFFIQDVCPKFFTFALFDYWSSLECTAKTIDIYIALPCTACMHSSASTGNGYSFRSVQFL
ncbi:hypothetical protein EGR_10900 [Echinococcus granulosus]|uniref:Uncharacterized protein n=1 Tax=Echinococcus granulosus TaxID=6210 RepID=W6TZI6_ECHGR|nr:hypothetical protein EGR_10900 [Echinococcus granulosus]EUB54240.1 hypothetical protein EGR_10900 [Echinococcus granulosus]